MPSKSEAYFVLQLSAPDNPSPKPGPEWPPVEPTPLPPTTDPVPTVPPVTGVHFHFFSFILN